MFGFFSKTKIVITNKSTLINNLTRLIEILRTNSLNAQAEAVQRVINPLILNDDEAFLKAINSVDMWGGSGAVWEVDNFRTIESEKEFCSLIIRLTELMKDIGIRNGKANSVSRYFMKELNK